MGLSQSSIRRRVASWRHWTERVYRVCLGDQYGSTLFVGSLVVFLLLWRMGVFLNDSYVLVNTLSAVADGQLYPAEAVVGTLEEPGVVEVGEDLYGRNYGQVFFAVPLVWLVEGIAAVVPFRAVIVACWSGLCVVFARQVGHILGRERLVSAAGVSIGGLMLLANVVAWKPFYKVTPAEIALQFSTILWASLIVLLVYRLLASIETPRVGVIAAGVTMLASPVIFWSSITKRHSLSAAFVVLVVYLFYRSRSAEPADGGISETQFRSAAYASIGIYAWTNAPEAFFVLLAFVTIDLPTARHNDLRSLTLIGTVFAISLIPFFLTNLAVTGNPIKPPVMVYTGSDPVQVGNQDAVPAGGGQAGGGQAGGGQAGGGQVEQPSNPGSGIPILMPLLSTLSGVGTPLSIVVGKVTKTIEISTNLDRQWLVFVRSGYRAPLVPGNSLFDGPGMNLSVLESAPIIGAVTVGPLLALRNSLRSERSVVSRIRRFPKNLTETKRATDLLVISLTLAFLFLYLPSLPAHHSYTVRYLHPVYPLAIYGVFRLPVVERTVRQYTKVILWTYEVVVLLGLPVAYLLIFLRSPATGDAYQAYAVTALVAAAALILAAASDTLRDTTSRPTAIAIGCVAGVATVFFVLNATIFVHYGISPYPVVEQLLAKARWHILG